MFAMALLLCASSFATTAHAQTSPAKPDAPADTTARADTTAERRVTEEGSSPNAVPYRSDRSVLEHVLAAPSYVLYGATRPLGWGVKYLEREYPALFQPQVRVRGVLPLLELGGPVGVQGGLALFHRNAWGAGHRVRVSGIYGSRNRYEIDLDYGVPEVLGPGSSLDVNAEFFTNPERRYFLRGNAADSNDESRYFTQQFSARTTLSMTPHERLFGSVETAFTRSRNKPADGRLGERLPPELPGVNRITNLLTLRTSWTVDLARLNRGRIVRGTRFVVDGQLTNDLDGDTFRYVRYGAEIQQYIPVGLLPPTRRLALRVRVDKVEPARGGAAVPFFRLPGIGGQTTVRSLVFERFVEEGALVANAEYNYPIWNTMDAVIFVDAGQVFNEFEQIAADRFHYSYGGGVRVLRGGKLAFRFEVAGGEGEVRSILTVNRMF
jgi:hemolysin activation/secretion protein